MGLVAEFAGSRIMITVVRVSLSLCRSHGLDSGVVDSDVVDSGVVESASPCINIDPRGYNKYSFVVGDQVLLSTESKEVDRTAIGFIYV